VHERPPDPAEAAGRPLEDKAPRDPDLHEVDEPEPEELDRDPHHRLNRSVGSPDPTADSDPYSDES
jgi:hypothetical protein